MSLAFARAALSEQGMPWVVIHGPLEPNMLCINGLEDALLLRSDASIRDIEFALSSLRAERSPAS